MSIKDEIERYILTEEFRQGVYVEVAGMTIDIVLLAILVPFVIWIVNVRKRSRANSMASFYTLQFIRSSVELLLKVGGAKNIPKLLDEELVAGRIQSLTSDVVYGNTENLFQLLKHRMGDGRHVEGHKLLTEADIGSLRSTASELLDKLDHYVFLFNSVGLPAYSEEFFNARMIIFPLRDYLETCSYSEDRTYFNADPVREMSTVFASYFHVWFRSSKALPDRIRKRKLRRSMVRLICSIPFVLAYRLLGPTVMKIAGKPYIDPTASDFFPSILRAITDNLQVPQTDLALHVGVPLETLTLLRFGYKTPPVDVQQAILLKARELIDSRIWTSLVTTLIFSDIARRKPGMAEFDAVKANALMWFVILVGGARSNDPATTKTFFKLFSLRPYDVDLSYLAHAQHAVLMERIRANMGDNDSNTSESDNANEGPSREHAD